MGHPKYSGLREPSRNNLRRYAGSCHGTAYAIINICNWWEVDQGVLISLDYKLEVVIRNNQGRTRKIEVRLRLEKHMAREESISTKSQVECSQRGPTIASFQQVVTNLETLICKQVWSQIRCTVKFGGSGKHWNYPVRLPSERPNSVSFHNN